MSWRHLWTSIIPKWFITLGANNQKTVMSLLGKYWKYEIVKHAIQKSEQWKVWIKSMTGKGIPDDSELLYLADHINIVTLVVWTYSGKMGSLCFDFTGILYSQRKCKTQKLGPYSRGECFLNMHSIYLWNLVFLKPSSSFKPVNYFSLLLALFICLQSSASSCPIYSYPSTFWNFCVQILTALQLF